jgi:hypothetical protein
MKRLWRWFIIIIVTLLILGAGGLFLFAWLNTAEPEPEALAAMESTPAVTVQTDRWLTFSPTQNSPNVGFIFYPGGLVDPRAYAPPAQEVAGQGFLVVIVPMPLNLAVLGSNRANQVMADFPQIENWMIGGHSLGGTMAARYAAQYPDQLDGLALWAAYPAEGDNLSDTSLPTTSIYGTRDGLVSLTDIETSRPLLPAQTQFRPIEGGNHAQFGWYGPQEGDMAATISHPDQQAQVVQATLALLNHIQAER